MKNVDTIMHKKYKSSSSWDRLDTDPKFRNDLVYQVAVLIFRNDPLCQSRSGADPGFMGGGGGGKISSEGSYIYERSELQGLTSEASINQLGVRRCKPPETFFEFRTPESESERNLTNYFILFLLLFY